MERTHYSQIDKYVIKAVCQEPLHIGSSRGDKEEVLTHPVDRVPFIQASGLAGVFREYFSREYGKEEADNIFGKSNVSEDSEQGSKIRFTDGRFLMETVKIELRPRIKLNSASGTVDAEKIKGSEQKSGQKFNMQYVAAGAGFSFAVYFFGEDEQFHQKFLGCLSAVQKGNLQFGGQKSNGCGYLTLSEVRYQHYNLKEKAGRESWFSESEAEESSYQKIDLSKLPVAGKNRAFDLYLDGETETELLVKGIAVTDYGDSAPDDMNIQNGKKEYIIPASSLKGAIRNRIEMIIRYKGMEEEWIARLFGKAALKEKNEREESGNTGLFCFYDTVIGEKEENDKADIRTRIRVDKFTGGVRNGALFSQKNTAGKVKMHFSILEGEYADLACALLVYALRDLANGEVTIGSGYSIGKGFIQADQIEIKNSRGEACRINFKTGTIQDEKQILSACMQTLKN